MFQARDRSSPISELKVKTKRCCFEKDPPSPCIPKGNVRGLSAADKKGCLLTIGVSSIFPQNDAAASSPPPPRLQTPTHLEDDGTKKKANHEAGRRDVDGHPIWSVCRTIRSLVSPLASQRKRSMSAASSEDDVHVSQLQRLAAFHELLVAWHPLHSPAPGGDVTFPLAQSRFRLRSKGRSWDPSGSFAATSSSLVLTRLRIPLIRTSELEAASRDPTPSPSSPEAITRLRMPQFRIMAEMKEART